MAKTPEELLSERTKRVNDAIELKVPDRVPHFLCLHQFPAKYAGITLGEAWYNLDKWIAAFEKTVVDFAPDLYMPPDSGIFTGGRVHEILGNKQIKWPGYNLRPDVGFQFVEGEYTSVDEYKAFLHDPSDFIVRQYLPRVFGALEGLSLLPPLSALSMGYVGAAMVGILAVPPVAAAFEALTKAAAEAAQWSAAYGALKQKLAGLGFVAWNGAVAVPPFDIVSDFLRGMRGAMLDMYRHPEELLAVQDKVLPMLIQSAVANCAMSGNPRVFIALHRGADGFMSLEQFETFYWPSFKALVLGLIEAGLTPCPFFEGVYDQRLEYLRELPKGKIMGLFDRTDLVKAKEIIGDTMCISGGMPVSLLQTGTPEQVVEQTRKVIDTVGKDGGFIMASNTVLDDARPDLIKVWVDATRKYGGY